MISLEEPHEKNCKFRPVPCFHFNCQQDNITCVLSEIQDHFKTKHQGVDFQEQVLDGNDVTNVKVGFGQKVLTYDGIVMYVFGGCLKIDEMPNSCKACLISTEPPEKIGELKCTIKMMCFGNEIISYNGNLFSIDNTQKIHAWDSGGLIYPADVIGRAAFVPDGLEIKVTVYKT